MDPTAQTALGLLSWIVAPTGLVVTSVLLWQNILKSRETQLNIQQAHLKIRQLEEQLRVTEERIYQPNNQEITEILREQRAFLRAQRDDLSRLQTERISSRPTGALILSLFLTGIAALPILGLLSQASRQVELASGAVAEQRSSLRDLDGRLAQLSEQQRASLATVTAAIESQQLRIAAATAGQAELQRRLTTALADAVFLKQQLTQLSSHTEQQRKAIASLQQRLAIEPSLPSQPKPGPFDRAAMRRSLLAQVAEMKEADAEDVLVKLGRQPIENPRKALLDYIRRAETIEELKRLYEILREYGND